MVGTSNSSWRIWEILGTSFDEGLAVNGLKLVENRRALGAKILAKDVGTLGGSLKTYHYHRKKITKTNKSKKSSFTHLTTAVVVVSTTGPGTVFCSCKILFICGALEHRFNELDWSTSMTKKFLKIFQIFFFLFRYSYQISHRIQKCRMQIRCAACKISNCIFHQNNNIFIYFYC